MFKKLIIFSIIAFLGGCETINQASQCDSAKNYIISNPQAMEEYEKLKSEGKVKSIFINIKKPNFCNDVSCVAYDYKKYDFVEKNFNDSIKNGVYKIKYSDDKNNKDCMKLNNSTSPRLKDICFIVSKNEDNQVHSDYEWFLDNSDPQRRVIKFNNLLEKENLFEYSYQAYSTGAIGGPGGSICPHSKINNPEFKFNPHDYP